MSYREDMKALRQECAKHKRLVWRIIKSTVIALAAAFLLTTVLLIVDLASDGGSHGSNNKNKGKDNSAPTIVLKNGDAIYMYVGETVSFKSAVTVSDENGFTLDVLQNDLDKNKPGAYTVTYVAKDPSGNTTRLDVKVVVTKREYSYDTLMSLIEKKVASLGINDKMSKQQQVFAVYEYVNSPDKSASNANIVFVNESNVPSVDRSNWENDWIEEAVRTLQSGQGDCYSYYSVSKAFFEYLGIKNIGIRRDDSRSEMSGTHFWSLVNIGSDAEPRWYYYDGTRLAGEFTDGTNNGCLRTYEELVSYVPNNNQSGFYAFDSTAYPKTETAKIVR